MFEARKLHKAVLNAHWSTARDLRKAGVFPMPKTKRFAHEHRPEEWRELLSDNAFIWEASREERLYDALLRGYWETANDLLPGAVPDERTMKLAVRYLDSDWVQKLTDALAAAGKAPPSSALYIAVEQNFKKKGDILIEAGVVPDEKSLHEAVSRWTRDVDWVKKLITAGAPVTPHVFAAALDYPDLGKMRALIKAGGVPDEETMVAAIRKLDEGQAEMLLDARTEAGLEPTSAMLEAAAAAGYKDIAKILIAQGVVPDKDTMWYALRHDGESWGTLMVDALAAAGQTPTGQMLVDAIRYYKKTTARAFIAAGAPTEKALAYVMTFKDGFRAWEQELRRAEIERGKPKQAAAAYNNAAAKPSPDQLVLRKTPRPKNSKTGGVPPCL